ncbi:hypothetical protein BUALT_Bualt12G0007500 [Buddleja alternifolia]|uniref:Uncharacterized protein n=1 Tax=Buddleja alternifolia TaxID=168488 RepID=A0AAV6WUT8_9LAMI|nr:hypothetical protein BUALT_Bualt12G0007500 [Buddleja alternifolia]
MKASIKFREEQNPLLRAKIPVNILNFPFQSSISAGESKELSLNLNTSFDSGPSIKFSFRPNDSNNPFSFVFKTGVGHFGSPIKSPLIMSAEFNLIGNQSPRFSLHVKPNFGDFSLKKSNSSGLGTKLNGSGDSFVNFNRNGLFPAAAEPRAAAGVVVDGLLKGTEVVARTSLPFRDFAVVNFRWGLKVPLPEAEEMDTVVVEKMSRDWMTGIRLPHLVMNKIGIEHVAKGDSKVEKVGSGAKYDDVAEACLGAKKQIEVIRDENGLLSKALKDLRSDIVAGKMDVLPEHRGKYSGGGVDWRGNADKQSSGSQRVLEEKCS